MNAVNRGDDATELLLGSDDGLTAVPLFRELADRLLSVGYGRTEVLPLAGTVADLCVDPVNLARAMRGQSNLYQPSALASGFAAGLGLVARPAVAAHRVFFAGQTVSAEEAEALLGSSLVTRLLAAGMLVAADGGMHSRVLAAPFAGRVYFADPVTLQDHPEYCYLGRSTFVPAQFLRRGGGVAPRWPPAGGRLLDLGCGAGVGALACADGFDEVLGTDIVARCLRFAQVNAAVNGVARARFAYSDLFSDVDGEFDLIVANTPCVWADAEPGVPRTYASGGGEFGLQLPLRMITGGLDRLRPGGAMLAVITAPVRGQEQYARAALDRVCAGRRVEAVLYPLLEEYEWRNARLYREHGISRMVRYLAMLRPGVRAGVSFGRFDTPRLLCYRTKVLASRLAARMWPPSG